jgi:hypothetical protein
LTAIFSDFFHFFRESEAAGCTTIYCQTVPDAGLGQALMDRLHRATSATEDGSSGSH